MQHLRDKEEILWRREAKGGNKCGGLLCKGAGRQYGSGGGGEERGEGRGKGGRGEKKERDKTGRIRIIISRGKMCRIKKTRGNLEA